MDAVLRALAEPHRRQILALVRDRELPAGSISERFRITRPAVSQHLATLKQAGLVTERRDGTRRLYRAESQRLAGLRVFLDDFWTARLSGLKREAEARDQQDRGRERISVEREIAIAAKPAAVWELLVDPEKATRWMGQNARFDPRPGGRYQVEVLPGLVAAGEYLEIDPPCRLVHTWGWELPGGGPVPPGSTIVVLELHESGNATRLRLCHRDLPSLDTAGSHSRGWAHYLPRLATAASGGKPDPDPWVIDPERMHRELHPASGSPIPPGKKGESQMSTKGTIEAYFKALSKGDGWQAFFGDDITFTSHGTPSKQITGRDACLESTKGFYSMIRSVEVRRMIVERDEACALTCYELEPPKGETFICDVAEVFAVKDGAIESFEIYFDSTPFSAMAAE